MSEITEISPEIITEAKSDGWAEKENWRGAPELWIDAAEFVRRKHTVLPLLRKENEKLFGPMDLDARCEQELEIMRAKANVKPQTVDSAPISSVKAVEMGGASYAPGVLRTSVPPASEMLKADVTEGKDVL